MEREKRAKALYEKGLTLQAIAEQIGCSKPTIVRWKKQGWKTQRERRIEKRKKEIEIMDGKSDGSKK